MLRLQGIVGVSYVKTAQNLKLLKTLNYFITVMFFLHLFLLPLLTRFFTFGHLPDSCSHIWGESTLTFTLLRSSCFLSLLLVAAVVWKIKQTCWASRRREVSPRHTSARIIRLSHVSSTTLKMLGRTEGQALAQLPNQEVHNWISGEKIN